MVLSLLMSVFVSVLGFALRACARLPWAAWLKDLVARGWLALHVEC